MRRHCADRVHFIDILRYHRRKIRFKRLPVSRIEASRDNRFPDHRYPLTTNYNTIDRFCKERVSYQQIPADGSDDLSNAALEKADRRRREFDEVE